MKPEKMMSYQKSYTRKNDILLISICYCGFPDGSSGKESSWNVGYARGMSSIPGSGRFPGETIVTQSNILVWKSHRQCCLADYSPWGHKELDMAKHAHINKCIL